MKKSYIILLSLLSIIIFFIVTALVNIDNILEKYIKKELNQIIDSSDNSIYEFKYGDVHFNTWNGNFEITEVEIQPKEGIIDSLKKGSFKFIIFSDDLHMYSTRSNQHLIAG